jgi:hypothetical protein
MQGKYEDINWFKDIVLSDEQVFLCCVNFNGLHVALPTFELMSFCYPQIVRDQKQMQGAIVGGDDAKKIFSIGPSHFQEVSELSDNG